MTLHIRAIFDSTQRAVRQQTAEQLRKECEAENARKLAEQESFYLKHGHAGIVNPWWLGSDNGI